MRFRSIAAFLALAVAAASIVGMAGCRHLPPSMPPSQWNAQQARGAAVFRQYCARCHNATSTRAKHGPGLQALTKLKAMPSGAPPTNERLTDVIIHGYGLMPATQLSNRQLRELLAYLHTL